MAQNMQLIYNRNSHQTL